MHVTTGDEVKLPCHVSLSATTNVTWFQTENLQFGGPHVFTVYVNGQINIGLSQRFSIYDATVGDYSLKILKVKDNDMGRYRCLDKEKLIKNYVLDVTGEYCFKKHIFYHNMCLHIDICRWIKCVVLLWFQIFLVFSCFMFKEKCMLIL